MSTTIADKIEDAHDSAIRWHNRAARPWATMRRAARLARELADARADLTAERETSARLADRVIDLGRELEELLSAVRAHETSRRAHGSLSLPAPPVTQADARLWAAAKVST